MNIGSHPVERSSAMGLLRGVAAGTPVPAAVGSLAAMADGRRPHHYDAFGGSW